MGPRGAQGHGPQGPMGLKDPGLKDPGPHGGPHEGPQGHRFACVQILV